MSRSTRIWTGWLASLGKLVGRAPELSIATVTLPYYLLYDRNTKSPILAIAQAKDEKEITRHLRKWLATKHREAQYVQVAGAVTFASAIGTLSWNSLSTRHWSSPACWYTCVVISITAVLSGAQQTILLESLQSTDYLSARKRLCKETQYGPEPDWLVMFAWQSPLMFLSYSLIFYMAGLTSFIVSPVAQNPAWNDDAKTLVFYMATIFCVCIVFVPSSRLVHQTISQDDAYLSETEVSHGLPSSSSTHGGLFTSLPTVKTV